jgi:CheY-like chemotaxis protein
MARHLLVVEDQADVAEMFLNFLETLGYRVSLAHDGQAALAIDAADPADLVLTDYSMPGMNGDELARRLQERRAGLPIIMISGYAFNAAPAGSNVRLLNKPVGLMKLADQIAELLAGTA